MRILNRIRIFAGNIVHRGIYILAECYEWALFNRRLRSRPPVFIYQMAKVGSSSLYHSLRKTYPGCVVRTHDLRPDHRKWRTRKFYDYVMNKKHPVNIISLTREPVSRNISAFFQTFERTTGKAFKESSFSLAELNELFLRNYPHDKVLEWFDRQIKAKFNIDVYASPFPPCGFATYSHDNVRLLVMKSEIPDSVKVAAVKDFLGLPDFKLENRNISSKKEYAELYSLFK